MRRWIILILLAALLLCGCDSNGASHDDTISFYYPRMEILYGSQDGVIAPELLEVSVSGNSLEQKLYIYLSGPKSEHLVSPFPVNTTLKAVRQEKEYLTVVLSDEFFTLEGLDMTIACASLAKTCFSLTDASELTVCSVDNEYRITLTRETYLFADDRDTIEMTIGTEPAQ